MFYIYEGSVDPERDIYVLRGLLSLLAWCSGSRRIFCTFSLSLISFFINFLLIFPIVRRLPPDETRATVFEGKEEKREVAVETKIRFFSSRFNHVYLHVNERVYVLWANFQSIVPINCGLSWFSREVNHSTKKSKIVHHSVDMDLKDLNPYGKKMDANYNVKKFFWF